MKTIVLATAAALFMTSAAQAGKQDFTLVNDTGYTISEIYVSPTKVDDWEEDVLGRDVLANGERTDISFARDNDSCLWDMKAVYEDGDTAEWSAFNLCKVSVISVSYNARTGETSAEYE